jgi:hypothetical protein
VRDVEAGRRAGVTPVLVRSGHGRAQLDSDPLPSELRSVHVADDLLDAVTWLLARERASAVDGGGRAR